MGILHASGAHDQQGTSEMRVSRTPAAVSAAFDDPNPIAQAGLVPVMRLAEQCGLPRLVTEKVKLTGVRNGVGAAADAKVTSSMGMGMAAGADSLDALDDLRHGAMASGEAGADDRAIEIPHPRPRHGANLLC
ncbi:hypothetical protein AB0E67_10515 [Streptomyces sp. NPDC032161]|uniref:hypothetical protein n=1 Tax=unclassified Streptomyces TaxID=2593676 RepID=UPI0033D72756